MNEGGGKITGNEAPGSYRRRIAALHQALGIPADYEARCGLTLQPECGNLVEAEPDVFGRRVWMAAAAHRAWLGMRDAARRDGVVLQVVSAYRSAEYQHGLFLRKLERGQRLPDILAVNAAPGYSEHHTGAALDLGCSGYEHLSESFEESPAFLWLQEHAGAHGFRLSFPRGNPHGVLYEPWHWKFD